MAEGRTSHAAQGIAASPHTVRGSSIRASRGTMNTTTIETALLARTYLYQITQMLFGDEPTEQLIDTLFSEATDEALDLFASSEASAFQEALDAFRSCKTAHESNHAAFAQKATRDYMRLLVGPENLKAPPWECVYRTNERVLFQESTLEVRQTYRSERMLPTNYPHVSDDHIAIELDFMNKLSIACHASLRSDDLQEYRRLLGAQRTFLEDHLAWWAPKYADDLDEAAPASLYACAGKLVAALCAVDQDLLVELEQNETRG